MKKLPTTTMVVTALLLAAWPAGAIERTWTGTTGNDWHTTANWDPSTGTVAESDDLIVLSGTPTTGFNVISDGGGSITLDGPAAVADFSDFDLTIGNTGQGSMDILGEADMSSNTGCIGDESGSTGTVTVDGAGSTWTNSNGLIVGHLSHNTNTLAIINGGAVSNTFGYVGNGRGPGIVTVDGAGSIWTNSNDLYIGGSLLVVCLDGCSNTGTLAITDGGTVSNDDCYVGYYKYSSGTVTVSGAGSTWTNNESLIVGYGGTGTLAITNGGAVSSVRGYLGYWGRGTGTVTVDGVGSTWTNDESLIVGYLGTGTLAITDGGTTSNTHGYIGYWKYGGTGPGYYRWGTGTVTVDGAGSTWTNDESLIVGYGGTGTLVITNGGVVSSSSGSIGKGISPGSGLPSSGSITIDGTGSTWTNSGDLYVGHTYGTGTLNVTGGGAVTTTGSLTLASHTTSSGTVNIEGGSLTVGSFVRGAGMALFKCVGDSATVSVDGDFLYNGSGSGTVVFELDGLARTIIDAGSYVDLSGSTIEIGLADGYSIAEGTVFTLFEAGDAITTTDTVFDYDPLLWNVTLWKVIVTEGGGGMLTAKFLGTPLPGDANDDGVVDNEDALILAAHWQQTGMNWADGDFSGDRLVDDKDASILAAHWQETDEEAAPVPEPSSFVLILLATLTGLVGFAWRKTIDRL